MKSAFIAVIGRPSSGKSTLINRICRQKVSIVSTSPQTTRNKIRAIYNDSEGQLVFIDTPGYHVSDKKFNLYLKEQVKSALEEVDLVLYVIDVTRKPGEEEGEICRITSAFADKLVIALNKIDEKNNYVVEIRKFLEEEARTAKIFEISGLTGAGVGELMDELLDIAPEGVKFYPEEYYTDQEPEFRASEIIREKAITHVRQEIPHALYVEISDMELQQEGQKLWIRAFLVVERESQKGIMIGRGGRMIRTIRLEAQEELNQIFPYVVHLDLRVKVNPRWRKNNSLLSKLFK
ncbi:MAG: GTPase Era [Spirochaetes bacterium]|nr:MAG: GTPase Era [Spirochaetota bacterium]